MGLAIENNLRRHSVTRVNFWAFRASRHQRAAQSTTAIYAREQSVKNILKIAPKCLTMMVAELTLNSMLGRPRREDTSNKKQMKHGGAVLSNFPYTTLYVTTNIAPPIP